MVTSVIVPWRHLEAICCGGDLYFYQVSDWLRRVRDSGARVVAIPDIDNNDQRGLVLALASRDLKRLVEKEGLIVLRQRRIQKHREHRLVAA